jgi:hypothetical protein
MLLLLLWLHAGEDRSPSDRTSATAADRTAANKKKSKFAKEPRRHRQRRFVAQARLLVRRRPTFGDLSVQC